MASKADSSNLQSILTALQKLSPADRQVIAQVLQSGSASILKKPGDGVPDWQSDLRLRGLTEGTLEAEALRLHRHALGMAADHRQRDND